MTIQSLLTVFDFDGTLADTSDDLVISTNHVRGCFDLPPLSRREVLDIVGRGASRLVADAIGRPIDHPDARKALAIFEDHYGRHQEDHVSLYPTVRETIEAISRDTLLAVLSNKPGVMVRRLSRHLGIDRWLRPIWGGDDVRAMKPDPDGLIDLMTASGRTPNETLMVGDLEHDIGAGRAAGVTTVLCDFGFRPVDRDRLRPDHVIQRMSDLPEVLARYRG